MADPADIGFINAHTKGTGADNERQFSSEPGSFQPTAFLGTQTAVVGCCGMALFLEPLSQGFTVAASAGVNQSSGRGLRLDKFQELLTAAAGGANLQDFQLQIGPVRAEAEHLRLLELQHRLDLLLRLVTRGVKNNS